MASSNGMKKFLLLLQQYPEVFCRGARLDLKCSEDVRVKQKKMNVIAVVLLVLHFKAVDVI